MSSIVNLKDKLLGCDCPMIWGAVAGGAALGLVGGLFSGKKGEQTTQSVNVGPANYQEQQAYDIYAGMLGLTSKGTRTKTTEVSVDDAFGYTPADSLGARRKFLKQGITERGGKFYRDEQEEYEITNDGPTFKDILTGGTTEADVTTGTQARRDYAAYAKNMAGNMSYDITAQDTSLADKLFAPREAAMQNNYKSMIESSNRTAAALGRKINDPILQAKLRQSQMELAQNMQIEKANYTAQLPQLRNQAALQQLGVMGESANTLADIGNRYTAGTMSYYDMLDSFRSDQANFRLQAAGRTFNTSKSGNAFSDMLTGAIGGAGAAGKILSGVADYNNSIE